MKGNFLKYLLLLVAVLFYCTIVSCGKDDEPPTSIVETEPGPVEEPDPTEEETPYEYVDMGLSVKWATCNVGAIAPEYSGHFFAWGEIEEKSSFTMATSLTWGLAIGDISGDPNYDAARANWGGKWRMPTPEEIEELLLPGNCSTEWTTLNNVSGMLITSIKTENSIFFPASGFGYGTTYSDVNRCCYLWSSSPSNYYNAYYEATVMELMETSSGYDLAYRFYGCNVRAVMN